MKQSVFMAKLIFALGCLVLVACSTGKVVKTYEGDVMSNEQLAIMTAPENIVVVSINGKRVKKYLLSDLNVNYGLKPGDNLVVFQYESVWAKAVRGDQDDPRSEVVASARKEVLITANAGEKLTFRFENANNVREARSLAEQFEAEVIDDKLNVVARSAEVGRYAKAAKKKIAENENNLQGETAQLPTLDALKVLWAAASAEEKKTFLTWAFQK